MVKSLVDACLLKIEENFPALKRPRWKLSRKHKEMLIERLCWHHRFTPHNVSAIVQHLFVPDLLRLNLSQSDLVDDKVLEELADSGCYPEYITIQNCPKVTGKGISCVARMTKRAEEVTLKDLENVGSSSLVDFGSPFISHLTLEGCSQITDAGLIAVVKHCPNLSVINISWLYHLTDKSIKELAKRLHYRLEELDAAGLNLLTSASTFTLAQHCPNLRRANFEACSTLNGCGIVEMAIKCKLQELNLSHCFSISDDMVQEIVSQSRLRNNVVRLGMQGVFLSQDAFDMTVTLPHLRVLELFDMERVNDAALRRICLSVGSRLTELSLSHCTSLTEQACESIGKHCCLLEKLSFVDLPGLTGAGLGKLLMDKTRAKQLIHLQVSGCEKFDLDIIQAAATKCRNLQTLMLEGLDGVDDSIVFRIARYLTKIQQLSLRNCKYTDEGICEVAKQCGQLKMLALDGNSSLTDKGVIALAENCPRLSELYLFESAKVTQWAVQRVVSTCINYVHLDAPSSPSGPVVKDLDSGRFVRVEELLPTRNSTMFLHSP